MIVEYSSINHPYLTARLLRQVSERGQQRTKLSPPRLPNLDDLARPPLVSPQHRPARSISLDERHLQLGAHDLERTCPGVDEAVEGNGGLEALLVRGRKVELDRVRGRELDGRLGGVDLLEVERDDDGCCRLVEIVSVAGQ